MEGSCLPGMTASMSSRDTAAQVREAGGSMKRRVKSVLGTGLQCQSLKVLRKHQLGERSAGARDASCERRRSVTCDCDVKCAHE